MERVTYTAACVLRALDNGDAYGFSIMDSTGLPSGTVYQILRRFERTGLVRSAWENAKDTVGERRPRRRYYKLTRDGKKALARVVERYSQRDAVFGNVRHGPTTAQ